MAVRKLPKLRRGFDSHRPPPESDALERTCLDSSLRRSTLRRAASDSEGQFAILAVRLSVSAAPPAPPTRRLGASRTSAEASTGAHVAFAFPGNICPAKLASAYRNRASDDPRGRHHGTFATTQPSGDDAARPSAMPECRLARAGLDRRSDTASDADQGQWQYDGRKDPEPTVLIRSVVRTSRERLQGSRAFNGLVRPTISRMIP